MGDGRSGVGRVARWVSVAVVLALAGLSAAPAGAAPSARRAGPPPAGHSAPGVAGLPFGAPAAATQPEPALPSPSRSAWPFAGGAFPRTSGTGRLSDGASYWSDFLYDDHGALGSAVGIAKSSRFAPLAPYHGGYAYPSGPARNDGADIFRAAVGLTNNASYWRVDWNTLADPHVPIAEWTFDTDDDTTTGTADWPANAGVRSAGIDRALVVSARGAKLVDAKTGAVIARLHTTVDTRARSFVVRVPRAVLPVDGRWRVRLASGLADSAGDAFADVGTANGQLTGQPNVYNVAFRGVRQEGELVCPPGVTPPTQSHAPVAECGNFWNENDQANTLATGDVSKYSELVVWSALAARQATAEPRPTGYSVRWYVSRLDLGQGVVANSNPVSDLRPNFLGRAVPYSVYVPRGYDPAKPAPLSWILHSLGANHNQYAGVAPSQLQQECQDRHSICATTLGFGPDGWYFDEAEVDFWQTWHALARAYDLDPDATVISGYSMGGYASYKLGLAYPDLFAKAMPLEGPPICGVRIAGQLQGSAAFLNSAGGQRCAKDSDTEPLVANARWLPYVMTYGVIDELVPVTGGLEQVNAFDRLGERYHAILYPAEDHLVFAVQNDFTPAVTQLGQPRRVIDPGRFTYIWYPSLSRRDYGIGPTGDYWVRDLRARDRALGVRARVDADSRAIPDASISIHRTTSVLAQFHPTPAVVRDLSWARGPRPAAQRVVTLGLTDVAALGLDTRRAGLTCGTVRARTDGPAALTLLRLPAGRAVTVAGRRVAVTDRSGRAVVALARGATTIDVACGEGGGGSSADGSSAGGSSTDVAPRGGVEAGEGGAAPATRTQPAASKRSVRRSSRSDSPSARTNR